MLAHLPFPTVPSRWLRITHSIALCSPSPRCRWLPSGATWTPQQQTLMCLPSQQHQMPRTQLLPQINAKGLCDRTIYDRDRNSSCCSWSMPPHRHRHGNSLPVHRLRLGHLPLLSLPPNCSLPRLPHSNTCPSLPTHTQRSCPVHPLRHRPMYVHHRHPLLRFAQVTYPSHCHPHPSRGVWYIHSRRIYTATRHRQGVEVQVLLTPTALRVRFL